MKLARENQERAQTFFETQVRPLERALYQYHFQEGTREAVFAALAAFQNDDGGFGHALEPDLHLKDSSVIATTVALQTLRDLRADEDHPLVRTAMHYLLNVYDSVRKVWPIAPENTQDAPCAPWWDDPVGFDWHSNPRPEVVGYFFDYPSFTSHELRAEWLDSVMSYLELLSDEIEMHELYCYLRLIETQTLPELVRVRLLRKLEPVVKKGVSTDPATWRQYGLQPLSVVHTPESSFAALFPEAIAQNLDFMIENQAEDGAWWPAWSWGDRFPEAWAAARVQWAGHITLANLKTLRSFGRLE